MIIKAHYIFIHDTGTKIINKEDMPKDIDDCIRMIREANLCLYVDDQMVKQIKFDKGWIEAVPLKSFE